MLMTSIGTGGWAAAVLAAVTLIATFVNQYFARKARREEEEANARSEWEEAIYNRDYDLEYLRRQRLQQLKKK